VSAGAGSPRLIRHTAFNLVGLGAPLLVAVAAIPYLVSGLGEARFGMLTLIWAVVSYFGLLDLGLGRALTLHLSQAFATGRNDQVGPIAWTALALMACVGLGAGLLLAALSGLGSTLVREAPDPGEVRRALLAMAVAMPFIVLTSGMRGVLEAAHRFGVINAIRVPMGVYTFAGPVVAVAAGAVRLDVIAWVLVAGRVVACLAHWLFAARVIGAAGAGRPRADRATLRLLAGSAGWLTVSNSVGPLMNYVDRFVIGATMSAGSVAHYATPHEMITKLWILPGALSAVLFPSFSAQIARGDPNARSTYRGSVAAVFAALLPVVIALSAFAEPLLSVWISGEFAAQSAPVLQVMAWGMLATCMATIPFTVIQSAGRARLTAFLQLAEFPVFLAVLFALVAKYGLVGAALAWALRNIVDAALLFHFAGGILRRLSPERGPA